MKLRVQWDIDDFGEAPPIDDGVFEIDDEIILSRIDERGVVFDENGKIRGFIDQETISEVLAVAADELSNIYGFCITSAQLNSCDQCGGEGEIHGIGNRIVTCVQCDGSGYDL